MLDACETQGAIVSNHPDLEVWIPRLLDEIAIRPREEIAPSKSQRVDVAINQRRANDRNQFRARHLVSVKTQNPIAAALRVQPTKMSLDEVELDREELIGNLTVILQVLFGHWAARCNHDLV